MCMCRSHTVIEWEDWDFLFVVFCLLAREIEEDRDKGDKVG